jgi:hypothetical protein
VRGRRSRGACQPSADVSSPCRPLV